MNITVKLFATLRNDRFDKSEIECSENSSVSSIITILDLDEKDVAIIFINGKHAGVEDILNENDTVAFFPPIGGG